MINLSLAGLNGLRVDEMSTEKKALLKAIKVYIHLLKSCN